MDKIFGDFYSMILRDMVGHVYSIDLGGNKRLNVKRFWAVFVGSVVFHRNQIKSNRERTQRTDRVK